MLLPRRQRHREVLPEALDSWSDYAVLKLATAAIRANTWGACPLDRLPFFMPFFLLPCCQKAATSLSMDCAVRTAGMQDGQGRGRGRKAPQARPSGREEMLCDAKRSGAPAAVLCEAGQASGTGSRWPRRFPEDVDAARRIPDGSGHRHTGRRLVVRLTSRRRLSADEAASD